MTNKTYYIHDNGSRPFKVDIKNKKVIISATHDNDEQKYVKFVTYKPKQIFIGKSEKNGMTEFSGGFGEEFDGNSILLNIKGKKYIFIGRSIFMFSAKNKIIEYTSPIGNSDVPYPYAIDKEGYIYLLIEEVIMKTNDELKKYLNNKEIDPYDYYCERNSLTNNFENIKTFFVGKNPYMFTYSSTPKSQYKSLSEYKKDDVDKNGISIVDNNNKRTYLTKQTYADLMKRFAKHSGFSALTKIMIHSRISDITSSETS